MQNAELYIFLAIAVIVGAAYLLRGNRRPPSESFICARCKMQEKYSPRTVEAWRKGFNKIYCHACHKLWLNKNPERKREHRSAVNPRGGCLGVVVFFMAVPPAIYGVYRYVA